MAQDVFDSIDPVISGTQLAGILNNFKAALMSGLSGTSRPVELEPGGFWVDTGAESSSGTWSFRLWTGSDDVEVFKVDLITGGAAVQLAVDSFTVRKVGEDADGALIELVKRRVSSSGQVQDGDVVGEIRVVGRTDTAGNPVVAKIVFTADEAQTSTTFGGTLGFYSTPEGTDTLLEHMRFINGIVESLVPHKINAQVLVSQNVATTATIAQLSADKAIVEMTGSTPTQIQGIESNGDTKQITIHNRSSADVSIMHLNSGAESNDQISLPGGDNVVIAPDESVSLLYSAADSKWKLQYSSSKFKGFTTVRCYVSTTLDIPAESIVVTGVSRVELGGPAPVPSILSSTGSLYAWGDNTYGQLGDGTTVAKSSPVAVLGGLVFDKVIGKQTSVAALTKDGKAYTWGENQYGYLGDGTRVDRSTPVAVVGGLKFKDICWFGGGVHALTGDGSLYFWGLNDGAIAGSQSSPVAILGGLKFEKMAKGGIRGALTEDGAAYIGGSNQFGQIGDGTTVAKSLPVAVVGGLKFKELYVPGLNTIGLTHVGDAYAWGKNDYGQLGDGTTVDKSSPVAVVGGLKFKEMAVAGDMNIALTEDGTAYAWGYNQQGELGVGDTIKRSSPTAVLGGLKFKSVIREPSNGSGIVAITTEGDLYAWGNNERGKLGVGDITPRSSPVLVLSGLKFVEVGTFGTGGVLARTEGGQTYAWGWNLKGQLGDGTSIDRSSPVLVLGDILHNADDNMITRVMPITPGNVPVSFVGKRAIVAGEVVGPADYVEITYANP